MFFPFERFSSGIKFFEVDQFPGNLGFGGFYFSEIVFFGPDFQIISLSDINAVIFLRIENVDVMIIASGIHDNFWTQKSSCCRTRTCDPVVNSHLLYQLS